MKSSYGLIYKILNKDNLIGITGVDVFKEYKDTIWLDWFTILPEYRKKGYGSKVFLDTIEDTETKKQNTIIYSYCLKGTLELWNNKYLGLKDYYDKCVID